MPLNKVKSYVEVVEQTLKVPLLWVYNYQIRMENKQQFQEANRFNVWNEQPSTFTQKFQCLGALIKHQNFLFVEKTSHKPGELYIENRYGIELDNRIVKVTELQLDDKIIRIVDSFSCSLRPQLAPQPTVRPHSPNIVALDSSKRLADVSQDIFQIEESEEPKQNTKRNIVKNIMRLFGKWLRHRPSYTEEFQSLLESQVCGNSKHKFNHKLIAKLSEEQSLRKAFIVFCEQDAEEMVSTSRIQDKQVHIQALRQYHRICSQVQQQQDIDQRLPNEDILVERFEELSPPLPPEKHTV